MWVQDGQVTRTLRRPFKGAALVEGCELAWGVGPESALRGLLKKSDCEGCGDVEPWVWGVESRQIELCECGHLKLVEELRSPRKGPIRGMSKHLRGRWAVVATPRTLVYKKKDFFVNYLLIGWLVGSGLSRSMKGLVSQRSLWCMGSSCGVPA